MEIDVQNMKVCKLSEHGYDEALLGLSLSFNSEMDKMPERAKNLAHKQGGHNKCLEMIMIWMDVTAPRMWWQQADTYRISTKQSESTMHTLMKKTVGQENFIRPIPVEILALLNTYIGEGNFITAKDILPEGFLQRRIWLMSYKTFQNIYIQRKAHKLPEWSKFLDTIVEQLDHPEFVVKSE